VASTKGMSATEGNNFLIREAHSVKDVADVSGALGSVWKTTVRGTGGHIFIRTAWSPGDHRTTHFLQGTDTCKGPKIGVSDPREFSLDRFEMLASDFKTGISRVISFRGKALQMSSETKEMGERDGGDVPL